MSRGSELYLQDIEETCEQRFAEAVRRLRSD
jgi:hypothetical protein